MTFLEYKGIRMIKSSDRSNLAIIVARIKKCVCIIGLSRSTSFIVEIKGVIMVCSLQIELFGLVIGH